MGSLPAVTSDAIALTEKKMYMSLDDIIKMSRNMGWKATRKSKASANKRWRGYANGSAVNPVVRKALMPRVGRPGQDKADGVRSRIQNNRGNQFLAVKAAARRAALAPIRTMGQWNKKRTMPLSVSRSGTFRVGSSAKINAVSNSKQAPGRLDSLFASMKVERMKVQAQNWTGKQGPMMFSNRESRPNPGGNDFRARRRPFSNAESQMKLGGTDFRRQRAFEGTGNQIRAVRLSDSRGRQRPFSGTGNQIRAVRLSDSRGRQRPFSGRENPTSFGPRRNYY